MSTDSRSASCSSSVDEAMADFIAPDDAAAVDEGGDVDDIEEVDEGLDPKVVLDSRLRSDSARPPSKRKLMPAERARQEKCKSPSTARKVIEDSTSSSSREAPAEEKPAAQKVLGVIPATVKPDKDLVSLLRSKNTTRGGGDGDSSSDDSDDDEDSDEETPSDTAQEEDDPSMRVEKFLDEPKGDIPAFFRYKLYPHQVTGIEKADRESKAKINSAKALNAFVDKMKSKGSQLFKNSNDGIIDSEGGGVVFAYEAGLGKTRMALAIMCNRWALAEKQKRKVCPSIAFVPKSVVTPWRDEWEKAIHPGANLRAVFIDEKPSEETVADIIAGKYHLVVTSYGQLRQEHSRVTTHANLETVMKTATISSKRSFNVTEQNIGQWKDKNKDIGKWCDLYMSNGGMDGHLRDNRKLPERSWIYGLKWDVVVFDEGHTLRNARTKGFLAAFLVEASKRLFLSGTPIHNSLEDLYNAMRLVRAMGLRDLTRWELTKQKEKPDYLATEAQHCVFWVKKMDVPELRMPPLLIFHRGVAFKTDAERDIYQFYANSAGRLAREASMAHKDKTSTTDLSAGTHVLGALTLCRQACTAASVLSKDVAELIPDKLRAKGFGNDDTWYGVGSSKMLALRQVIVEHIRKDEKFVIFSNHLRTLELATLILNELGIGSRKIVGSLKGHKRSEAIREFRADPKVRCMLMTYGAGATGLSFEFATRAILVDPWWNPKLLDQAMARVHRLISKQEVRITILYMSGTIEKIILDIAERKREISEVFYNATSLRELLKNSIFQRGQTEKKDPLAGKSEPHKMEIMLAQASQLWDSSKDKEVDEEQEFKDKEVRHKRGEKVDFVPLKRTASSISSTTTPTTPRAPTVGDAIPITTFGDEDYASSGAEEVENPAKKQPRLSEPPPPSTPPAAAAPGAALSDLASRLRTTINSPMAGKRKAAATDLTDEKINGKKASSFEKIVAPTAQAASGVALSGLMKSPPAQFAPPSIERIELDWYIWSENVVPGNGVNHLFTRMIDVAIGDFYDSIAVVSLVNGITCARANKTFFLKSADPLAVQHQEEWAKLSAETKQYGGMDKLAAEAIETIVANLPKNSDEEKAFIDKLKQASISGCNKKLAALAAQVTEDEERLRMDCKAWEKNAIAVLKNALISAFVQSSKVWICPKGAGAPSPNALPVIGCDGSAFLPFAPFLMDSTRRVFPHNSSARAPDLIMSVSDSTHAESRYACSMHAAAHLGTMLYYFSNPRSTEKNFIVCFARGSTCISALVIQSILVAHKGEERESIRMTMLSNTTEEVTTLHINLAITAALSAVHRSKSGRGLPNVILCPIAYESLLYDHLARRCGIETGSRLVSKYKANPPVEYTQDSPLLSGFGDTAATMLCFDWVQKYRE